MEIPFSKWYPAIENRRSYRQYDKNHPIEPDKLAELETVCKQFTPFTGARACLVTKPVKDIFRGIVGSYGKVKNAPSFIAFVGNSDSPTVQEEVGYTGEGVILEATALGLDTCWVGGFFSRKSVASSLEIKANERVFAVTPVGYRLKNQLLEEKAMAGFGRHQNRLSVS